MARQEALRCHGEEHVFAKSVTPEEALNPDIPDERWLPAYAICLCGLVTWSEMNERALLERMAQ